MSTRDNITLDGDAIPRTESNGYSATALEPVAPLTPQIDLVDHRSILAREEDRLTRRNVHRNDTDLETHRRESELEALRNARHNARLELSARLGEFGFAYDPRTGSFTRHQIANPPAPIPSNTPAPVRAPFDPKEYGLPQPAPRAFNPKVLKAIDYISWAAVLPLGAFIGFSIGHLAGLRVEADPILRYGSMVFGVAILATMKGSLYAVMHHAARRARTEERRSITWLAFSFAALMIVAEAGLGMVAIRGYSQDKALDASEVLPWWAAALIALCFSTPILVASVVKGWAEGREHDDQSEKARIDCERHQREEAEALQEHDRRERAKQEEAKRHHEEAVARFEAANLQFREDPRWQGAMALFGAISTYDIEIEERERLLKTYKISRGYNLSTLEKEA